MQDHKEPPTQGTFLVLADHPALDLLNTVALINGEMRDALQSDADVLRWLAQTGFLTEGHGELRPASLLHAMRNLREVIRPLVEKRKAGKRADIAALNAFLAKAHSHLTLMSDKDGSLRLKREWQGRTPELVLGSLAETAAEFLATADFNMVRRCESDECVLWFYDRTKSHHRRWCSMATCGNRHKVAAYRARQQGGAS